MILKRLQYVIFCIAVIITGISWIISFNNKQLFNTDNENSCISLHQEITSEFQQIKHLIGANTNQQTIYLKIMLLRPTVSPDIAKKIAASVWRHSRSMKKNPDLILAVISVESQFIPDAISSAGAEGIMQIMPVWKKTVCNGYNLREIDDNIKCGTQIYSLYEAQYKDIKIALTVYNRGPSVVDLAISRDQNPHNDYADKVLSIFNRLQAIGEMGSEDI